MKPKAVHLPALRRSRETSLLRSLGRFFFFDFHVPRRSSLERRLFFGVWGDFFFSIFCRVFFFKNISRKFPQFGEIIIPDYQNLMSETIWNGSYAFEFIYCNFWLSPSYEAFLTPGIFLFLLHRGCQTEDVDGKTWDQVLR
jgi:hypothetical protein